MRTTVFVVLLAILSGCTQEVADTRIKSTFDSDRRRHVEYAFDERTGLCFASRGYSELVLIPCSEPVMALIRGAK